MARTIGWVDPEAVEVKKNQEQVEKPAPVISEEPKAEEKPKKKTTKK